MLMAALFIPVGFGKLTGFAGTVGYIRSVGLPLPEVGAVIAIAVELGLGLLLLIGWKARWAAFIMAIFTMVTGVFFHNYWAAPAGQAMMQQIHFFKNVAIAGGLLFIPAGGPGRFALGRG
jgi:putative oxidoreductase